MVTFLSRKVTRILSYKSKFEESALECDTAVSKNKTDMRFAFGLLALFSLGANVTGIDTGQLFVEL